jgi:hypothetical protein
MIFELEKIESLVAQCRLSEAAAMAVAGRAERSLCGAVCVLAGEERAAARFIAPELLSCRNAGEVAAFYAARRSEPSAYDLLVAGVVLAWSADETGSCDAFRAKANRSCSSRLKPSSPATLLPCVAIVIGKY